MERIPLYREVAKLVAEDVPFVRLYTANTLIGMSKKVRNFVQFPDNFERVAEVWLAP